MQTLWRYISTQFIRAFLGSLLILALVVLVVDMLLHLGEILESQDSAIDAVRVLLLRTASTYLAYLIPVAAFVGSFVALGQTARTHELVAMKAGGVSPLMAIIPVLVLSIGIALLALVLNETIGISSARALAERSGGTVGDVSLRSGTIWYHTGRFVYNIRDPRPESDQVYDVRVFERNDEGRLVRLIHADRAARLAPQEWSFWGATVRRFSADVPTQPPEIERAAQITVELAEDRDPHLQPSELAALPLTTLSGYVGGQLESGGRPAQARALLHERMTVPLLSILFVLLAIPLALSVEQTRSLAMPALQGVGILFAFLLVREYGGSFAAKGVAASAMAPWLILSAFAVYGSWQLSRVPR